MKLKSFYLAAACAARLAFGYDYEGHFLCNELAVTALPDDFPAFAKTDAARKRIAFLGGEPDRWRNTNELPLKHANGLDHYVDIEDFAPLDMPLEKLSAFRYEFVAQLGAVRAAHPERFAPIDPAKDTDRTRQFPGFLPWTITEYYAKLESGFSTLKTYQKAGTPEEIANTEQNIIYVMGVMGHFVADASQPLHTTRHYNGWVGENPNGYTTNKNFHAWIDGGFLNKAGFPTVEEMKKRLRPAHALWTESNGATSPVFREVTRYIDAQHDQMEPLYKIEKEGKLDAEGKSPEGREFICRQMAIGAQMLGDLWETAWQQAPMDTYLLNYLARRNGDKDKGANASGK